MVRDKGARLKSKTNLSLTVGLKVLYNEYHHSAKKNEVVSGLLARNILISLARVGEVVQHVCMCGLEPLT